MTDRTHDRDESARDTLADVTAMIRAAENDPAVAKRLGHAYIARVRSQIDSTNEAGDHQSEAMRGQHAEHGHIEADCENLLTVMQEIRDAVIFAEQPAGTQSAFGRGAQWSAGRPEELERAGHNIALAIDEFPAAAKAASIDAQHRHDLIHFTKALTEARTHHKALVADRKNAVAARGLLLASLRAASHHIRLAAQLLHRREPEKLAHFNSPVAHHRVVHRVAKGTTPGK